MESVAYQIHNLFNAVEDLLKIVAASFENQITDTARWHTALLQRMTQEVVGNSSLLTLSRKLFASKQSAWIPTFLPSCLWNPN